MYLYVGANQIVIFIIIPNQTPKNVTSSRLPQESH